MVSQINDYFDIAYLAIVNAKSFPLVIILLRDTLGFKSVESATSFSLLSQFSLKANSQYLLFYVLWLYVLIEHMDVCDCEINVDLLGAEPEYH